ncbi:MAG: hypothetical protein WCV50_04000 [Patescibacteria group bacterium]|jgi:hypothetical protein
MYKEIFIVAGALLVLLVGYNNYSSKAKFQNIVAARLIFFRSLVGMIYITVIYYVVLVWQTFSVLYYLILIASVIILAIIDRQIKKTATKAN